MILESDYYPITLFVTNTYEQAPLVNGEPSLYTNDHRDFLESVRHKVPLRYVAVGEYGSITRRPHYHYILYCEQEMEMTTNQWGHLEFPQLKESWPHGYQTTYLSSDKAIAYVAGYTLKKMGSLDYDTGEDRNREFTRWSNGIGARYAAEYVHATAPLISSGSLNPEKLPRTVRRDGKKYPLDRYLREKIKKTFLHSQSLPVDFLPQLPEYVCEDTGEVIEIPEPYPDAEEIKKRQAKVIATQSRWRNHAATQPTHI